MQKPSEEQERTIEIIQEYLDKYPDENLPLDIATFKIYKMAMSQAQDKIIENARLNNIRAINTIVSSLLFFQVTAEVIGDNLMDKEMRDSVYKGGLSDKQWELINKLKYEMIENVSKVSKAEFRKEEDKINQIVKLIESELKNKHADCIK